MSLISCAAALWVQDRFTDNHTAKAILRGACEYTTSMMQPNSTQLLTLTNFERRTKKKKKKEEEEDDDDDDDQDDQEEEELLLVDWPLKRA